MTQAQLLSEFRQLSLAQQLEVIQAFLSIVAQHVQAAEQNTNGRDKNKRLAEAANLLLEDYETDQELTSFTAAALEQLAHIQSSFSSLDPLQWERDLRQEHGSQG